MWGTPVVLAFFVSVNSSSIEGNAISLEVEKSRFVAASSTFDVAITIAAEDAVNVTAAIVSFPSDKLWVNSVSSEGSAIDLWAEDPFYSNELGVVTFAGGMTDKGGFTGTGTIAIINFRALKSGRAPLEISSPAMLAHNGQGTNVLTHTVEPAVVIRKEGRPNPDLNNDGSITISDINTMYLNVLRPYSWRYDLDDNGKTNFADIAVLFSLLGS